MTGVQTCALPIYQAAFAKAIDETAFVPYVLPLNWNFRPKWHLAFFGPIKIWHDYADVPPPLYSICQRYERPDSVIQFHRPG